MSFESFFNLIAFQAAGHFAAGIVLALADRLLSRPRPESYRARLAARLDGLKILAYLRDLEVGGGDTPEEDEVREACAFLRGEFGSGAFRLGRPITATAGTAGSAGTLQDTGAVREREPTPATAATKGGGLERWRDGAGNAWERFRLWLLHEKVNPCGALAKLRIGYVLEITADLIAGVSQLAWGRGNFFQALGHSIYQGAALGLGWIIGAFFVGRRDHRAPRKLRKAVERLERDLSADPHAVDLLGRVGRGELPRRPAQAIPPAGGGADTRDTAEGDADHAP